MKRKRAGTDATPAGGTQEHTPAAPRGGSHLIPAVVIAVGLLGGGFLMGGKGAGPAQAAAEHPPPAAQEVATHGPVQNLESITLNLADGRFLKVGLALQLADAEGGYGAGEDLPAAKALDSAITLLGSYTMEQLGSAKARDAVKAELSDTIADIYTDPATHEPLVTKVYFTEFVMQ
jgi:flagellar protein FliL